MNSALSQSEMKLSQNSVFCGMRMSLICDCLLVKTNYYLHQGGYDGATENAGQENDGQENDGQKCNTQNALIDH